MAITNTKKMQGTLNRGIFIFVKILRVLNALVDIFKENESCPGVLRDELEPFPTIDIYDAPDAVCLLADMPGVEVDDVSVTLVGENLMIKGKRKEVPIQFSGIFPSDALFFQSERKTGVFARTVNLPKNLNVDEEKLIVQLEKGSLFIKLEKKEPIVKKELKIKNIG